MKQAKQRKFFVAPKSHSHTRMVKYLESTRTESDRMFDLFGVPRHYRPAVEIAAAEIQKAIDDEIINKILEKQNETH